MIIHKVDFKVDIVGASDYVRIPCRDPSGLISSTRLMKSKQLYVLEKLICQIWAASGSGYLSPTCSIHSDMNMRSDSVLSGGCSNAIDLLNSVAIHFLRVMQ